MNRRTLKIEIFCVHPLSHVSVPISRVFLSSFFEEPVFAHQISMVFLVSVASVVSANPVLKPGVCHNVAV